MGNSIICNLQTPQSLNSIIRASLLFRKQSSVLWNTQGVKRHMGSGAHKHLHSIAFPFHTGQKTKNYFDVNA
jgi:hypothetical protein